MRRQLQQELKLLSLTHKSEWRTFCEWLKSLEAQAFERAYLAKSDEQRDKYFGEIKAYRNIVDEIGEMENKAEETAEAIKDMKKGG